MKIEGKFVVMTLDNELHTFDDRQEYIKFTDEKEASIIWAGIPEMLRNIREGQQLEKYVEKLENAIDKDDDYTYDQYPKLKEESFKEFDESIKERKQKSLKGIDKEN